MSKTTEGDRTILRELAKRFAEIAGGDIQQERIRLWKRHNSLQPCRPLLLVFPEGSWRELIPQSELKCQNEVLRGYEWHLRTTLYEQEHFDCDNVVFPEGLSVGKKVSHTGWGIEAHWHHSDMQGGAKSFDPVIKEPSDLKKLKMPEVVYDEQKTMEELKLLQETVGDILPVRLKGVSHVSFHLLNLYTSWRGLEETMMDMYAEPAMLHDAMSFLEAGHRGIVEQYERMNLLSLNNDNTYHSSGGNGWTDELPSNGFDPARVRPKDMWASAEAQELALVSPEMHREFSLAYEKRLLAPFALTGYGCCEDLTNKLDDVLTIPGIRRISIAPWATVEKCAEKLGGKCIFSWKPNPAHMVGDFDKNMIATYIQRTVDACAANGCVLEIILKDTHTCENKPARFDEWTRICRTAIGC